MALEYKLELPSLPPPQNYYQSNSQTRQQLQPQQQPQPHPRHYEEADYDEESSHNRKSYSALIIQDNQLTRKNLKVLLHLITGELKSRGTKTPHIFLPFRSRIDDSKLERFLMTVFPNGTLSRQDEYLQILKRTDEFTLVCSLKYLWSRLPNHEVIGWDVYLEYKRKEKQAGYPRNAFLLIMPKCLSSAAHALIVYDFLDLLISVASNSQYNYLSGRKISKMASIWAFNSLNKAQSSKQHLNSPFFDATIQTDNNFIEGLEAWKQTSGALFHLLLSFLRAMLPDNEQETLKLPKTLQSLLITNSYPPLENSDSIKSLITIPCVLVRSTKPSSTAFELLSKVRNTISFDKKDAFVSVENYTILKNIFRKNSTNEIISTLTEESRRILNRITSDPILSDFGIYPGWFKPDPKPQNRFSYDDGDDDDDIPLISQINIIDVTLQDYYIWTWLSTLSSDQYYTNKRLFGRSLVVEAGMKGFEKWLIVSEETITPKEYYKNFKTLDNGPKVPEKSTMHYDGLRSTSGSSSGESNLGYTHNKVPSNSNFNSHRSTATSDNSYKYMSLPPPPIPDKGDEASTSGSSGMLPEITFGEDDYRIEIESLGNDFQTKNTVSGKQSPLVPLMLPTPQLQSYQHVAQNPPYIPQQYQQPHPQQYQQPPPQQYQQPPPQQYLQPYQQPYQETYPQAQTDTVHLARPPPPTLPPTQQLSPMRSNPPSSSTSPYLGAKDMSHSPNRMSTYTQYYSPENQHNYSNDLGPIDDYEGQFQEHQPQPPPPPPPPPQQQQPPPPPLEQQEVINNPETYIPGTDYQEKNNENSIIEGYIQEQSLTDDNSTNRAPQTSERLPTSELSLEELEAKKERRRQRRDKKKREEEEAAKGVTGLTRSSSPSKDKEQRRKEREERKERRERREKREAERAAAAAAAAIALAEAEDASRSPQLHPEIPPPILKSPPRVSSHIKQSQPIPTSQKTFLPPPPNEMGGYKSPDISDLSNGHKNLNQQYATHSSDSSTLPSSSPVQRELSPSHAAQKRHPPQAQPQFSTEQKRSPVPSGPISGGRQPYGQYPSQPSQPGYPQHGQYPGQHGQPPAPHGQPPAPHGQPPAPHGQPPAPHGQPLAPHGQPPAPHGQPPAPHGQPPAPHGQPLAPHGQLPAPHGQLPGPHGQPSVPHGAPSHGAPRGAPGPPTAYTQFPQYPPQPYMYPPQAPPPQGYYYPQPYYPGQMPYGAPPMGYPPMGYPPMGYPHPKPPSPEKKEKKNSSDAAMRSVPQANRFDKNKQVNKVGMRQALNQGSFGI